MNYGTHTSTHTHTRVSSDYDRSDSALTRRHDAGGAAFAAHVTAVVHGALLVRRAARVLWIGHLVLVTGLAASSAVHQLLERLRASLSLAFERLDGLVQRRQLAVDGQHHSLELFVIELHRSGVGHVPVQQDLCTRERRRETREAECRERATTGSGFNGHFKRRTLNAPMVVS